MYALLLSSQANFGKWAPIFSIHITQGSLSTESSPTFIQQKFYEYTLCPRPGGNTDGGHSCVPMKFTV